jgi:hypothetical protein
MFDFKVLLYKNTFFLKNLVQHEKKLENGDFDCGVYDNFKG